MKNYQMLFLGSILFMLSSCVTVFQTSDATSIATQHQKIAIIAPDVQMSPLPHTRREVMEQIEKSEATNLQYEMYDWMLRRQMRGQLEEVSIQSIETTNQKLEEAGYHDGTYLTEKELCELLEVDAILKSNYTLNAPFVNTGTIVTSILLEEDLPSKETTVMLSLYDHANEKQIWQYRNQIVETAWDNRTTFVQSFMRHASRRMPYWIDK